MTAIVNIHQAKSTLSQLIAQAERGEDVVIARNGVPVARLTAITRPAERRPGVLRAQSGWQAFRYDPILFAPMTDAELAGEGWM